MPATSQAPPARLPDAEANIRALQQELGKTANRAKALLDQSPLAIVIFDETGRALETNRRWRELWRAEERQIVGQYNILADAQFQEAGIRTFFAKAAKGANVLLPDMEYDPAPAGLGGGKRWVRSHLFPIVQDDGVQIVLAQQDISSCIQCEERYNIVVDNANEAIMVVQDGLLKFFNQKALDIAGYSHKEDFHNKPFIEFVPPDHQQMIMDRHLRRQRGEAVPNFYQVKVIHKKGHIIWLQLNAVRIDWEGRPASLVFLYDITDHKRAEEELLQYKNRLEEMVRERTRELERALQEVKTLRGLIPVCARCKSIRDDKGYWKRMEDYLRSHSEADITHGLCPDCAKKLYPDLFTSQESHEEFDRLARQDPQDDTGS